MEVYGLMGKIPGRSFARRFYTGKFREEQLHDHEYRNFELHNLIVDIPALKADSEIKGLNVTIPYKHAILPFLDEMSPDCKEIGVCNCIQIKEGRWIGYNTEHIGFKRSFIPHLKSKHTAALILGTGSASRVVAFVLKKLKIPFLFVSRKNADTPGVISYSEVNEHLLLTHKIVINTTPLGMEPYTGQFPELPYESITPGHYFYDLIYNPTKTPLLAIAEEKGAFIENGENMLMIQAEECWRIWKQG